MPAEHRLPNPKDPERQCTHSSSKVAPRPTGARRWTSSSRADAPRTQAEPGYAGALNLVDRDTGNALMIVLWETEAQARRPLAEYGVAFLKALAGVAAISTGTRRPISVWDVNARA